MRHTYIYTYILVPVIDQILLSVNSSLSRKSQNLKGHIIISILRSPFLHKFPQDIEPNFNIAQLQQAPCSCKPQYKWHDMKELFQIHTKVGVYILEH